MDGSIDCFLQCLSGWQARLWTANNATRKELIDEVHVLIARKEELQIVLVRLVFPKPETIATCNHRPKNFAERIEIQLWPNSVKFKSSVSVCPWCHPPVTTNPLTICFRETSVGPNKNNAKISEYEFLCLRDENVLGFYIAMNGTLLVNVGDPIQQTTK